MKISSRPSKPELELVDMQTTDVLLNIDPITDVYTLTVTASVEVPRDVVIDYDLFSDFIKTTKTSVKLARQKDFNEEM